MSDALLQIAPNSTKMFFSNLMLNYGIGIREFEASDFFVRYAQVRRYFGYSMNIDINQSVENIQAEIKKMFIEYEELIIKYPDGVPDPIKRLKEMSNAEKDAYIDESYKRSVNISLCHALVNNMRFKLLSLKDALKARVMTTIEQISNEKANSLIEEQKFWQDAMNSFNKDDVVPF
jgi:hypothetical protein